jgi:DNA-binding MarR family transcriptional regulator
LQGADIIFVMTIKLQDVGLAIKRVQHRHHRAADIRLAPLGTTLVQWDALRHISQNPDSSSHQLALLTFQTDQSFGALATRLENQKLITREQGPGRAILHRLTPAGKKLMLAGHAVVDEILTESFSPLKSAEMKHLHDLLMRLLSTESRS